MRQRRLRIGRKRPGRRSGRAVNIVAALCVSVILLGVLGFGYGTIPALGPALDPGRGAWTSAAGGEPTRSETLSVTGLQHAVTISFTKQGVPSISAASDHDMFLALGYVHAQFRLSELDEERRLGEGRLAQLGCPTDLASDEFELRLGLLRTAEQEWAQMPKTTLAAQALIAYAQGVNARLAQVRASGQWPAVFSLPGVYPKPWTPVDSLVIQGVVTQELDFTSAPLDYALLERSLGAARTLDWFPLIAKNAQTPYDPGPYTKPALTPLPPAAASTLTYNPAPDNPAPYNSSPYNSAPYNPAPYNSASDNPVSDSHIGAISAGYYPQVGAGCQPWLPMSGTGSCDIKGVIPYSAEPQVYDPPSHVLATANQRPVTAAYPYYIGTTANFFDPGYRAATIYAVLRDAPLTPASFAAVQTSLTDHLAARMLPKLLSALNGASLSSAERSSVQLLHTWNSAMAVNSAAASVWWTFWGDYLSDVFQPWWNQAKVPVHKDSAGLTVSVGQASLDEDLEAWTLGDAANPAYSLPSGDQRTAPQVMRTAFATAVAHLSAQLGGAPSSWAWGRLHSREFPSLSGAAGLGYGPRADGGDPFTPDAADGGMTASTGPSWRMIVTLSSAGVSAQGVYPGGQSENPASPWYDDQVPLWWDGQYLPVPPPGQQRHGPGSTAGSLTWTLAPAAGHG